MPEDYPKPTMGTVFDARPAEGTMDMSYIFGYRPDSLAGLLPDPPSQPPPDSHGPPILSSNELQSINMDIEAMMGPFVHTQDWQNPPRQANHISHNSLPTQEAFIPAHESYPLYEGYTTTSEFSPHQTIAPYQLHGGSGSGSYGIGMGEFQALNGLRIHAPPNTEHVFPGAEPIQSNVSPFDQTSPHYTPQTMIMPSHQHTTFSQYQNIAPLEQNGFASQSPTMFQNRPSMRFGNDHSFGPEGFTSRDSEEAVVQRLKKSMECLEPEASATNTRRNSLDPDDYSAGSMSPPLIRKRKAEALVTIAAINTHPDVHAKEQPKKRPKSSARRDSEVKVELDITPAKRERGWKKNPPSKGPTSEKKRGKGATEGKRPALTAAEKKQNHKNSEAKRRARTKRAYARLYSLIPGLKDSDSHKNKLDMVIETIRGAIAGNDMLEEQLRQLS